jgi:hypothetical protein
MTVPVENLVEEAGCYQVREAAKAKEKKSTM